MHLRGRLQRCRPGRAGRQSLHIWVHPVKVKLNFQSLWAMGDFVMKITLVVGFMQTASSQ